MTVEASRFRGRWSVGSVPDAPGFRRRQRLLAALLALHLPGMAALAVVTGREPHEVLVQGAVVVVAIAVGAFLDISPRLRALALTGGLLWCSGVVGMLTGTVVTGALHAAAFGLLAAAHLGASWRSPRPAEVDEAAGAQLDEPAADTPAAAADEQLVEVQEVYTGVWSAKHLVRPTTRLVRIEPTATAEPEVVADLSVDAEVAPVEVEPAAVAVANDAPPAARDHELTREVLEALHLGTVEPAPAASAPEHATSGSTAH
jgi:hypothetical protein